MEPVFSYSRRTPKSKFLSLNVVCREGPARGVPFRWQFQQLGGITIGYDFQINLVPSDQEASHTLLKKKAAAAIVPRPYGFVAEDKGFHRMLEWNDMVDDPLPITIETTMLIDKFGHYRSLAERTFNDYLCYMDESLQIDMLHMGKLVAQVSTDNAANARQIVSEWAMRVRCNRCNDLGVFAAKNAENAKESDGLAPLRR